jgi:hypothetical protein
MGPCPLAVEKYLKKIVDRKWSRIRVVYMSINKILSGIQGCETAGLSSPTVDEFLIKNVI